MKNQNAVIKRMQLSEKGSELAAQNKYLFEVDRAANKLEIKQAVESLYSVKVKSVNTMRYEGKRKRERTARYGKRPDWKRAVVTLVEGDNIDLT